MRAPLVKPGSAAIVNTVAGPQQVAYGLPNYLPDRPDGEDHHSVEQHIKWLKTEWTTRPLRPDYEKISLLMLKTLSDRQKLIVQQFISIRDFIAKFPWLQDEHEVSIF